MPDTPDPIWDAALAIAINMEVHAAIGSTTQSKAEDIHTALLVFLEDNALDRKNT